MRKIEKLISNEMSHNFLMAENFGEFHLSYNSKIMEDKILEMIDNLEINYHNQKGHGERGRFYLNTKDSSPSEILKLIELITISDKETSEENRKSLEDYFDILREAQSFEEEYVKPLMPEYGNFHKLQDEFDRFDWYLHKNNGIIKRSSRFLGDIIYNQEQNIKHGYDKNYKIWRWNN